jgi:hypothetical protein
MINALLVIQVVFVNNVICIILEEKVFTLNHQNINVMNVLSIIIKFNS